MNNAIFCTAGHSGALEYAQKALADRGIHFIHRKDPDVTHLLLPVPSFETDGRIKGGGILENILADLPEELTAPIAVGQKIGEIRVLLDENVVETLPVTAVNSVDKVTFKSALHYLLENFFGCKAVKDIDAEVHVDRS